MTDGIYDPKFEVEANLTKTENWKSFFVDLAGQEFDPTLFKSEDAVQKLSDWMDFWSPGNHDDRTLIVLS
ncbi:MAG: hypothetical protein EOO47_09840 [Flavobacterium sp.]|nr:MAG: hypothetical protein EOO47_09840 [Flavobacterium sp.]